MSYNYANQSMEMYSSFHPKVTKGIHKLASAPHALPWVYVMKKHDQETILVLVTVVLN